MLKKAIKLEIRKLDQIIEQLGDVELPAGTLAVIKKKNRQFYVLRAFKARKRTDTYLGTATDPRVHSIKTLRFKSALLKVAKHNKEVLFEANSKLLPMDYDSISMSLPENYWEIPMNSIQLETLDAYYEELVEWAGAAYEKNPRPFGDTVILAADGRRVRSRGECLEYNLLLAAGIPFRYDAVMEFIDEEGKRKTKCPDFIITCLDGKVILIEHVGRLDKDDYLEKLKEKIGLYFQNGFVLGVNFFITSDSPDQGIDTESIQSVIEHVRGMFYGFK